MRRLSALTKKMSTLVFDRLSSSLTTNKSCRDRCYTLNHEQKQTRETRTHTLLMSQKRTLTQKSRCTVSHCVRVRGNSASLGGRDPQVCRPALKEKQNNKCFLTSMALSTNFSLNLFQSFSLHLVHVTRTSGGRCCCGRNDSFAMQIIGKCVLGNSALQNMYRRISSSFCLQRLLPLASLDLIQCLTQHSLCNMNKIRFRWINKSESTRQRNNFLIGHRNKQLAVNGAT